MIDEDWPETVPILSADNVVRWSELSLSNIEDSYHTIEGWAIRTFCLTHRLEFFRCFLMAIKELSWDVELVGVKNQVGDFADKMPRQVVADTWNRAMFFLGYTEDNPQTRKVTLC
jgi:hypothetical protein